ncbi:MAG TPA: sigma-54-dependent Fis family transcriptional regulator [Gammaproteobacteria bacterium]|nr:sigma-54-dependent Fis family transcriptional regulator [Gammaproteobacteria bacterium]
MALSSVCIYGSLDQEREQVASLLDFFDIESRFGELTGHAAEADCQAVAIVCREAGELADWLRQLPDCCRKKPVLAFFDGEDLQDAPAVAGKVFPVSLQCRHRDLKRVLDEMERASAATARRRRQSLQSLEGGSASIQRIKRLIEKVANTPANVLVLGESGTGKELVARAIHRLSDRGDKPFVPVNCGAIPKDLLESELFGHEKGAFTGAITARTGRFELARGGTLFLDEIGDMDVNMQVKLLRVLQEKTFERVGSNRSLKADVRIIAATHRNLEEAIAAGRFREDLYYRLNVFPIEMPPLRERREDIPALAQSMIDRLAKEQGGYRLDQRCLNALMAHDWPGNVRELANLIERLRILYPDQTVRLEDLPAAYRGKLEDTPPPVASPTGMGAVQAAVNSPSVRLAAGDFDLKAHLQETELSFIHAALTQTNGVVAAAAKLLNLRRTTLVEKMRKYHIEREEVVSQF